jgi:CRP/FNR family transcriptional regulator, anaerobic regulatory protein
MAELFDYCQQFSPLEPEALAALLDIAVTKTFRKGQYVLRKGQVCRSLLYVNNGLIKSCFSEDGKEFVMRFFSENLLFSVFDSYFAQSPSKFALVALEPTTVTAIDRAGMETLCAEYHSVETFFRKLLSVATSKMTNRISEMLEGHATDRYDQFVGENSAILQRIGVGDIANYLGITPQSLSRIRAARVNKAATANLPNGKKRKSGLA